MIRSENTQAVSDCTGREGWGKVSSWYSHPKAFMYSKAKSQVPGQAELRAVLLAAFGNWTQNLSESGDLPYSCDLSISLTWGAAAIPGWQGQSSLCETTTPVTSTAVGALAPGRKQTPSSGIFKIQPCKALRIKVQLSLNNSAVS